MNRSNEPSISSKTRERRLIKIYECCQLLTYFRNDLYSFSSFDIWPSRRRPSLGEVLVYPMKCDVNRDKQKSENEK